MPQTREMPPRRREMPHSRLRRLRLHTIPHLDGRSIAARRAKAVVRDLVQALGATATPMQLQAIERAAMHVVIAEDYAARKLAGEAVCALEMIRAEKTARRSVAAAAASTGNWSTFSVHRNSMTMFLPSTEPSCRKPARTPSTRSVQASAGPKPPTP